MKSLAEMPGFLLRGPRPALGLVLENECVEEVLGGFLLFRRELSDGVKLESEIIVGPPFTFLEHELVDSDTERRFA